MAEHIAESIARLPAPALRPFIERYIGYRLEGFPAGVHRGLPSRHLTFAVSLDEPIHLSSLSGVPDAVGSYQSVVSGLHPGPALIRHNGTQVGLWIEVTPLGARRLFGVPGGALASCVAEPHDLLGRQWSALPDRLLEAVSWSERCRILDEILVGSLKERGEPAAEVEHAWRSLVGTAGGLSVEEIAREVGWSRRHFSERFRSEIGLSPKVAARVLRFERARQAMESPGRPPLAEVAAACGYFDQAHFTREFNEFAGCPPTVWMAEELPSVQDNREGAGGD